MRWRRPVRRPVWVRMANRGSRPATTRRIGLVTWRLNRARRFGRGMADGSIAETRSRREPGRRRPTAVPMCGTTSVPDTCTERSHRCGSKDGRAATARPARAAAPRSGCAARASAEVAEAIRSLAVRGAPAIGVAAAYGLALAPRARRCRRRRRRADCAATRPTAVNLALGARPLPRAARDPARAERAAGASRPRTSPRTAASAQHGAALLRRRRDRAAHALQRRRAGHRPATARRSASSAAPGERGARRACWPTRRARCCRARG